VNVYATAQNLSDWLPGTDLPDNAEQLLRSASLVVAVAANLDPYTDPPTSPAATVLADATCAQTASWIALKVNPAAQGLDISAVSSSKIGTADVKRVIPAAETVTAAATALAPEARAVLLAGGLLWQPAPAGADQCDDLLNYGLSRARTWPFSVQRANQIDAW
jgi:hypothetical protein